MSELKPCPFCGGNDVHVHTTKTDNGIDIGSKIVCYGCLAVFCQAEACSIDENEERWQTSYANKELADEYEHFKRFMEQEGEG